MFNVLSHFSKSGMDLPGVRFNMASERILIEHNVFETVPALHFLYATLRSHA